MRTERTTHLFGPAVRPLLLLLPLVVPLLSSEGRAQSSWTPFNAGLYGASVRSFALGEEGTFLAATNGGIYRRDPMRDRWDPVRTGCDATGIGSIGGATFLAGMDGAMYRSVDGGATWDLVDSGLFVQSFGRVDGGVVIVAGSIGGPTVLSTGVRRSLDNGLTWNATTITPDLSGTVVFSEGKNDRLLAGTVKGIFISDDQGATWSTTPFSDPVFDLARHNGSIYAASAEGVFATIDNGASWSVADTLRARLILFDRGMTFAVVGAGIDGGLYRTGNFGDEWERMTGVVPRDVEVDSDARLWLALGTTPLYSPDQGNSWVQGDQGMTSTEITDVIGLQDNVLTMARGALYRLIPSESRWEILENAPQVVAVAPGWPLSGTTHSAIGIAREVSSTPEYSFDDVLYVSDSNGLVWTEKGRGGAMTPVAVEGPRLGAAGHGRIKGSIVLGGGLLITRDGGATWDSTSFGRSVASIALSGGTIYAGAIERNGEEPTYTALHRSLDSGRTWEVWISGIAAQRLAPVGEGRLLAMTRRIEAGTQDTLLGHNMLTVVDGADAIVVLADTIPVDILLARPGLALIDAVLSDARVVTLRSTDEGRSWSTVRVNDNEGGRLSEIIAVIGPGLMGIAGGIPCVSTDQGATWMSAGTGLPRPNANALAHRGSGSFIVGTKGDGLFISADLLLSPLVPAADRPPDVRIRLVGRDIEVWSDEPRWIFLDLIDPLGRQAAPIVGPLLVEGRLHVPLTANDLPRGWYLIRGVWTHGIRTQPVIIGE